MLDRYTSAIMGMMYGGNPGNYPGRSSLSGRDLGYTNAPSGRVGGQQEYVGAEGAMGRSMGGGGRSDVGGLNQAFGGKSKRSPDWQAYGRGAYPTTQNFMATQPTYYNYSGGGPDPDRMMLYPNNPEMWDKNGWIAGGDSPGRAREFGERRRAFMGRMR
jgi:hypothetical protein